MKRFFAFLFCAAMLCGFAGCSDDDEGNFTSADLIGKWINTYDYGMEDGEAYRKDWSTSSHRLYFTFYEDGTGLCEEGGYSGSFVWTLNGRWLEIMDNDGVMKTEIVRLTRTEMEFGHSDEDGWYRAVYERVFD